MKIKTVPMVALNRQTYGTRRLQAGDVFEVRTSDVATLIALRRAERSTAAPSAPVLQPAPAPWPDLAGLRAQYEALAGKKAHNFWKADKLKAAIAELAAAKGADEATDDTDGAVADA
jgi:hypothetical protein